MARRIESSTGRKLAQDFRDSTFRVQVLDEGEYEFVHARSTTTTSASRNFPAQTGGMDQRLLRALVFSSSKTHDCEIHYGAAPIPLESATKLVSSETAFLANSGLMCGFNSRRSAT